MIRITALGPLRVEKDGVVLDRLPARRLRLALLLYLGVEREATREQLMGVFWGDRPPDRARHLLSQTLYELRQDLGEAWMTTAGEQVAATPELVVDAEEFAAAVEADRFDEALEIYDGAFLAGATLGVSREFEGWIDRQEARIGRLHRRARRGAIDGLVEARRLEEALARARDWVELDPLDDEAQHRLIELMAATGDRSGALRQYDRYAALVASQLELEPLDETQALVARIRQGEVGEREATPARAEGAAPRESAPSAPEPASRLSDAPDAAAPPTDAADRRDAPAAALAEGVSWLRQHSMVRWTITYLAGAVVALEGTSTVAGAFDWPPMVVRALAVALGLGALGVMATAWTHSSRGRRFGVAEVALFGLVALFGAWVVSDLRSPKSATAAESAAETLDPRRIAVLYFDDHSAEQDLGPIAAGFTEALIHELDQAEGLEILSRTAVEPYRQNKPTLDSIIRDLRAGTLVEGSLTRVGDSLRVTFQLIDAAERTHHMSGTLHRPVSEVHTIVRDLPQEVARRLRRRLGQEVMLQDRRSAANNADAWTFVQRARLLMEDQRVVHYEDRAAADALLARADSLLEGAQEADPAWPEPALQRARVDELRARLQSVTPGELNPEIARKAIEHATTALAIDDDYPPALEQRGILQLELAETTGTSLDEAQRLYRQSESDLRTAVELDPQRARGWWALSRLLNRKGSMAEAKQAAHRALAADAFLEVPASALFQLFNAALVLEEHEEAKEWCRILRDRHYDDMRWAQCQLMLLGTSPAMPVNLDRSWALVDSVVERGSEGRAAIYRGWGELFVAKALVRAGLPDSARAVARRAIPDDPPPSWAVYDLAHLHLLLGEIDRTYELLEIRARNDPGPAGSLATDWWFRPLHGDPRLERLIQRATEAAEGA